MDSKEYKETMKKIEEAKKMNKEAHKLSLQAEALSVIALVINFIAKQSLEDEYKQYHTLKGNGVGTQMYNALMALPTEPPTEPQHEREE